MNFKISQNVSRSSFPRVVARGFRSLTLGATVFTLTGCAYRFSNLHVRRPQNIKSIAIEAIYDTSREVLPHEIIWGELQQAFARDGHLVVASRKDADAILRAHITNAAVGPSGEVFTTKPTEDDPKVFDQDSPPSFNEFRRLPYAGEARKKMTFVIVMQVEVWHLETKELLLDRVYNLSGSFQAIRPSGLPDATGFLRTEESMQADIALVARQAAESVVQDLLIR